MTRQRPTTVWSRVASTFVRPAAPANGVDALRTLDGATEAGPWAPPVALTNAGAAIAARSGAGDRSYAVLAAPAIARSLGAATALGTGSGAALLACWGAGRLRHGMSAPVSRPARRLAAALAGRGLDVRAAGRLVEVALCEDEEAAVDDLRRAEAAAIAAGAISVVVLGAARSEAWDGVLATRDAVLLRGDDETILGLALTQLAAIGAEAHRLERTPSRLTLALATAGVMPWGASAPLRAAIEVVP